MTRRTQAERRAATQEKLERGAIQALVKRGVSGATTAVICKEAGLSQGALFQHYETKQEVLVAGVLRLYTELRVKFAEQLAALPDDATRTERILRLLWESFHREDVVATLELYASCRTNPELKAILVPMLDEHWLTLSGFATDVLPPRVLAHPNFPQVLALLLAAVQSAATGSVISNLPTRTIEDVLAYAAQLLDPRSGA